MMEISEIQMKIIFYGYNSFIIESGDKKLAIDPGALFCYFFRFTTLIPQSEWKDITHILVTHGDPDHYWHADHAAKASNAAFICNKTMVKNSTGQALLLGPRAKGLAFTTPVNNLHTISVGESLELDDIKICGIKATHGPLTLKIGPIIKTVKPGPDERIGWGSIGYKIQLHGKTIVNLGDTLLHTSEWESINEPDVLMIPIGGKEAHNTMDEEEALQAVKMIQPKIVIPVHYNLPALFTKKYCAADVDWFKSEAETIGCKCVILDRNTSCYI